MAEENKLQEIAADTQAEMVPNINLITPNGVETVGITWNLQLAFTETVVVGGKAFVRPAAIISLQWPLAKALRELLDDQISAYEKREGTVLVPKTHLERNQQKQG